MIHTLAPKEGRSGLTVIELLAAITIIIVLIGLMTPAVQSARESMRITLCQDRLRQIGIAANNHVVAHRHFPTNGWGYGWLGVADAGYGKDQPGGWVFNLLPFLGRDGTRQLLTGDAVLPNPPERLRFDLPEFRCPSRPGPDRSLHGGAAQPFNAGVLTTVAKTDYAICEGDYVTDTLRGPSGRTPSHVSSYRWADTKLATGFFFFQRSKVKPSAVFDGLSHTYLVGEKHVSRLHYGTSGDPGHDQSAVSGVDLDINRWTHKHPSQDSDFVSRTRVFGSAHSSGFSMGYCDGSVRMLSYSIDIRLHRSSGNRLDGSIER